MEWVEKIWTLKFIDLNSAVTKLSRVAALLESQQFFQGASQAQINTQHNSILFIKQSGPTKLITVCSNNLLTVLMYAPFILYSLLSTPTSTQHKYTYICRSTYDV